jgi:hypothetical protein
MPVAPDAVIVARHVHVGVGVPGLHVAGIEGRAELHELVAHDAGQLIVKFASDSGFLFLLSVCSGSGGSSCFLLRLLIAVNAEADGTQEVKEDIYFCYLNSIPLKNLEELYNLFYENLLEEQEILRREGGLTLEVKKEFEEKLENLSIYNILYEFSERKAESVYSQLLYE